MKKLLFGLLFFLGINIVPVRANSAQSYIVMEQETGRVFDSRNHDTPMLIASITKIMTCIIAIENGDLNKVVTADKSILKGIGSSIYIEIGEKLTLKDLLYGMMLRSGNDAAILVAHTISGDMKSFSNLMNEYAKKIGMENTIFYNSHGLEEDDGTGNKSTAYDMALLTSYAMQNKTFREIFSTKNYVTKSDKKTYSWQNKNKLLRYDYVTGGKTGYTQKARRTLITTAIIEGINLVVVTLNDGNDWNDHLSLYESIKNKYQKVEVLSKKDFEIIDDTLYVKDTLYIKNDVKLTLKEDEVSRLKIKYYLINKKKVNNNEKVGSANIYLNDTLIYTEPIFIKVSENKTKGFFKKWIKKLFG